MKNISQHQVFFNMTKEYSKLSKCQFTKVGAIAVNENGRTVATGLNGTLPGATNCCDMHFKNREDHVKFTRENEIHAELNLILEIARSQINFKSLTIYITISPCFECLKVILGLRKVSKIIYGEKYHRTTDEELEHMINKCHTFGTVLQSLDEALEDDLDHTASYYMDFKKKDSRCI